MQNPDSKVIISCFLYNIYIIQSISYNIYRLYLTHHLAKLARIGNERKIGEYRLYEKSEDYKKLAEGKADDDRIAQAEFEDYDEVLNKLKSSIAYQIKVFLEINFKNSKKLFSLS